MPLYTKSLPCPSIENFQNQGLNVWPQKDLSQTWQPGAKYIYQKHHHKQEFVGGKEGPVGPGKLWHMKQVSQVMNINLRLIIEFFK